MPRQERPHQLTNLPVGQSDAEEALLGYERAVLGWFLTPTNATKARDEIGIITGGHFYLPAHEVIWHAIEKTAGVPDAYLRVLDVLISNGMPRALQALDQSLAAYLSDLVKAAEAFDAATMRFYAGRVREAHTQRHGRALLGELATAFARGDVDTARTALDTIADMLDTRPAAVETNAIAPFGDVAALLANGIPETPPPTILRRDDGRALFYEGKVNVLFGDPESGKTWVALAAVVDALNAGKRACVIDLDHNGIAETVSRLLALGARPEALADRDRFLYVEPEDAEQLTLAVRVLREWAPAVAVVDSVGELLPMLGGDSNSNDDYTRANRATLTPLANAGAAVLAIDHLPKGEDKREFGAIGAAAKRRAVNGVMYRVTVKEQFAPGRGGSCDLRVEKDRPGGVRAHCPGDSRAQPAGRFVMTASWEDTLTWRVTAPRLEVARSSDGDIAELDALDPPPKSQRDVQTRLSWGSDRSMKAIQAWRQLRSAE